jgi:NADH dehydrogenase
VLGLGSVTHFYGLPGLEKNALTMKSLGDALYLRNRLIALLEEANFECSKASRKKLLTFAVAGGGFAGVETVAAIHDFLHATLRFYRNLTPADLRVILVHSGEVILPELNSSLGKYAGKLLQHRGIEVIYNAKVVKCSENNVTFSTGESLKCSTVIWTAGNAPNPLLSKLQCSKEKGRLLVEETLQLTSHQGVWALGDCAAIPISNTGKFHPPTAQHATRQGKIAARNIVSSLRGQSLQPFRFRTLGQLASLGRRRGVAQIFGFCFSGIFAWWLWRTIYLMKLPRLEKKFRVAVEWTLDLIFPKEIVQIPTTRTRTAQATNSDTLQQAVS